MVQISVDTEKDSPEMIAKLIEVLNAHLGNGQTQGVSSNISSVGTLHQSSNSLPSSAPVSSAPSMFDVFGEQDRPNQQQSNQTSNSSSDISNPFSMFDEPSPSKVESNSVAGYADDDLFNAFSSDTPTTNFSSSSAPDLSGLDASFQSAQSLLDDNFNPITDDEDAKDDEIEEKSSNFFNFEQY